MVDGRLNHHLISRSGEAVHCHTDAGNNAGNKVYHLFCDIQIIALFHPINDCPIVTVRFPRITQHFTFTAFTNGIHNKRSCTKIHICHPQRNQIRTSPHFLRLFQLNGGSTVAVYYFIKIVFHYLYLLKSNSNI